MRVKKRRKRRMLIATLTVSLVVIGSYLVLVPVDKAEQQEPTASTASHVTKKKSKVDKLKTEKSEKSEKPEEVFPDTVAVPAIDSYLKELQFSGTALIVKNDKVLVSQGYGFANQVQQKPNTSKTRFLIGSTQKALIATAILQLVAKNKLQLTDPIGKYLPGFPNGDQITIKHLLNHTSGLAGRQATFGAITPYELVTEIEQAGINQAPGTWHYLDNNYEVLAYLVEKETQQPLVRYLQTNIFAPAQMSDVVEGQDFYQQKDAATSYKWSGNNLQEAEIPDLSQEFGAGDLSMTATDLYRFDHALMTGKLLKEPEKAAILTPGSSSSYGMGFYVNPASYMNHGVLGGFNTINSMSKDGMTYILLLGNTNSVASLGQAVDHLYTLIPAG